jgi:hypothetical protein
VLPMTTDIVAVEVGAEGAMTTTDGASVGVHHPTATVFMLQIWASIVRREISREHLRNLDPRVKCGWHGTLHASLLLCLNIETMQMRQSEKWMESK